MLGTPRRATYTVNRPAKFTENIENHTDRSNLSSTPPCSSGLGQSRANPSLSNDRIVHNIDQLRKYLDICQRRRLSFQSLGVKLGPSAMLRPRDHRGIPGFSSKSHSQIRTFSILQVAKRIGSYTGRGGAVATGRNEDLRESGGASGALCLLSPKVGKGTGGAFQMG